MCRFRTFLTEQGDWLAAIALALLPFAVGFSLWFAEEHQRGVVARQGRAEAERDIESGTMKWKIWGHMAGGLSHRAAGAKLRERFGVELEVIGLCCVTQEQVKRAEAYNERIRQEVEHKHGAGAINRVWEEARQQSR
jgi:hypothetical protein